MSEQQQTASGKCACMGAGPALTDFLERMGPSEEVKAHFRAARLEVLKGIRALLDARIEQLSRTGEEKGSTIPVE